MGYSWVQLALKIYTELILCFTICVHSATRHNIHDTKYTQVIQNTVNIYKLHYKLQSTDTNYTELIESTLNWCKLHSSDTNYTQLIQTALK